MRRAVLDPGVLVSALMSPAGAPARLLAEVRDGGLELVLSPLLLAESAGVLAREKFRRYVGLDAVGDYLALLEREGLHVADPETPSPLPCADPDDDYLVVLARAENATLVSGDRHLLDLADRARFSPRATSWPLVSAEAGRSPL